MVDGIPVVIVESGGFPVCPVEANAPLMTVAANGLGAPITLTDDQKGAPFIIQGYTPPEGDTLTVLATDLGQPLISDDGNYVETF